MNLQLPMTHPIEDDLVNQRVPQMKLVEATPSVIDLRERNFQFAIRDHGLNRTSRTMTLSVETEKGDQKQVAENKCGKQDEK